MRSARRSRRAVVRSPAPVPHEAHPRPRCRRGRRGHATPPGRGEAGEGNPTPTRRACRSPPARQVGRGARHRRYFAPCAPRGCSSRRGVSTSSGVAVTVGPAVARRCPRVVIVGGRPAMPSSAATAYLGAGAGMAGEVAGRACACRTIRQSGACSSSARCSADSTSSVSPGLTLPRAVATASSRDAKLQRALLHRSGTAHRRDTRPRPPRPRRPGVRSWRWRDTLSVVSPRRVGPARTPVRATGGSGCQHGRAIGLSRRRAG